MEAVAVLELISATWTMLKRFLFCYKCESYHLAYRGVEWGIMCVREKERERASPIVSACYYSH